MCASNHRLVDVRGSAANEVNEGRKGVLGASGRSLEMTSSIGISRACKHLPIMRSWAHLLRFVIDSRLDYIAYFVVHSRAVASCFARSDLKTRAISGTNGSSTNSPAAVTHVSSGHIAARVAAVIHLLLSLMGEKCKFVPGFGSVNNEQIDNSTFDTVSAGLH